MKLLLSFFSKKNDNTRTPKLASFALSLLACFLIRFFVYFRQITTYPYYIAKTEKYEWELFFLILLKTFGNPILYPVDILIYDHKP